MKNAAGFTLVEIMVVIVIIGLLATLVTVAVMNHLEGARVRLSHFAVKQVATAVGHFQLDHGRAPRDLRELVFPPAPAKPYLDEVPLDGWKRELVYRVPGTDGFPFDVVSLGPDETSSDDDIWNHARRDSTR